MAIYFIRASNFLRIGPRILTSTEANWNPPIFFRKLGKTVLSSKFFLQKPAHRVTFSQKFFNSKICNFVANQNSINLDPNKKL